MGIKRFFKNKIKDRNFINNKRKLKINHFELDFFKKHTFGFIYKNEPEVSIIIPVYNQIRYTLNCLYTIEQYDKDVSKEIIIINDNSSDETLKYLDTVPGITIINNTENLGFLRNINKGIRKARGRYIYLLNNDVEVQENYLSSLLEVFKNNKNVGAVGSKMVFADNTLQEAGCLIFNNTEIVNLGRGEAIDTPKYNFLRKVDYCSGCSLLLHRTGTDGKLNLLDEAFLPAYYEETDLCQRLKYEQNLHIYYQPKSEIVHFENISYTGKDNGKELLLQKNRTVFMNRWDQYFTDARFLDNEGRNNINRFFKKPNILILEERMPQPDKDSGSRRFLEIVKILQKNNHRVILGIQQPNQEDEIYVDFFRSIGVEVCEDYVNAQNKIVRVLDQVKEALHYVDIVWIFRPIGFDFWYGKIKNDISGKKIIYDMVDLYYLRMERENKYIEVTKSRKKEVKFFKEKEFFGMQKSDVVISISDEEKKIVSDQGIKDEKIFTVSNIHEPAECQNVDYSLREGVLFIGGFYHMPNMDAVKFLYEDIMPLVWAKDDSIKVYILGPYFPEEIKEKYNSEKFQILGYQKSVNYWFENSRIFVAPLRYGAGVKGKIGQALEFGLPVITTSIGAEGMDLEDQKTALVSNEDPQHFANKILELYYDENLWKTLHNNSALPLAKFSVRQQEKNINNIINYLGFKD
ncbi:glycosyltransferase [Chryseobacterium candidae]|uniref:Glycosyltransferase n=1 Tax=Chryseobacterium candidae TaxID=1978493 RepID=A0ABY2RAJ4_9FLAO|nr:glycosyltransferase [Chryseobacterium candidae]THV62631.1 glycosyltransferase [Chryseobacterium candidae]